MTKYFLCCRFIEHKRKYERREREREREREVEIVSTNLHNSHYTHIITDDHNPILWVCAWPRNNNRNE